MAGAGVALLIRKGSRIAGGQLGAARHSLYAMPDRWWNEKIPRQDKLCYRRKTDALNKFRDWNQAVIDAWGGETAKGSGGEFDALTKFEVAPTDIAEALWASLPAPGRHRKFCLEDIDIEALNNTSPGINHPVGFQLPDYVVESKLLEEVAKRQAEAPIEITKRKPRSFEATVEVKVKDYRELPQSTQFPAQDDQDVPF